MKEYIERDAVREYFHLGVDCNDCEQDARRCQYFDEITRMDICSAIDDIPAADVVEVDSVIPFVRVCDRKEYIKNSEKLINEYLAELLERFGILCLAQIDNINGTVKFWVEKMDGGADDDDN